MSLSHTIQTLRTYLLWSAFLSCCFFINADSAHVYSQETPNTDDFELEYYNPFDNLDNLLIFGRPSPTLSTNTPDGQGTSFDNNGDGNDLSGAVISNYLLDYSYGCRIEADMFVTANHAGCWLVSSFGLSRKKEVVDSPEFWPGTWFNFSMSYEGDKCWSALPEYLYKYNLYTTFITDNGTQYAYRIRFPEEKYLNRWIHVTFEILSDMTVRLTIDGEEIFHSEEKIDPHNINLPLVLGMQSSIYGDALLDNLEVFTPRLPGGKLQFEATHYHVQETDGTAHITVLRTLGTSEQVTVGYTATAGTAIAGSDFEPVSGTLLFHKGQRTATISIPIFDDTVPETLKTIHLKLQNPTDSAVLGYPAETVITIHDNEAPEILYVDHDAPPGGNGYSWASAYNNLQTALELVASPDNKIREIWVRAGVYTPDDLDSWFSPVNNVKVYGGFEGSETSLAQRDFRHNITILSGDINQDDTVSLSSRQENAPHVINGSRTDPTAVLDGFTITSGFSNHPMEPARQKGAGMYNIGGSPTIKNCTFVGNWANYYGGAVFNQESNSLFLDCIFIDNGSAYGGANFDYISNTRYINCKFFGNYAYNGGALILYGNSNPVFVNCVFSGNTVRSYGGAIDIDKDSIATFTNCSFSDNYALFEGGAINATSSNVFINNSILWFNLADDDTQQIKLNTTAQLYISYSNIQGGESAISGPATSTVNWLTGNIDQSPRFVNPAGPDNIFGTMDDDLRLLPDSPCIDAADNNVDIDLQTPGLQPILSLDLDHNYRRTDSPDVVDTGQGTAPLVDMGAYEFASQAIPHRIFVNSHATNGRNDGSDWDNAFLDLGRALDFVRQSAGQVREIWVAGGPYHPQNDSDSSGSNRQAAFHLQNNLAIYGGFAGGETERSQRNLEQNPVILSGDLEDNDGDDYQNREDNSFHVIIAEDNDSSAVLDGFIIEAGYANTNDGSNNKGAGLLCINAKPTLRNCTFRDNWALVGSAVFCDNSYLGLDNCVFTDNQDNQGTIYAANGGMLIESTVDLRKENLIGSHLHLEGTGVLHMNAATTLHLKDSDIRCRISGPGKIMIDIDATLNIDGNAQINLIDDTDPSATGTIECNGLLQVTDRAIIENTRLDIYRANFIGDTIINNSVITAESGAPFGQFFIDNTVKITDNTIYADGDRYMDLDPKVFAGIIKNNHIHVTITEGINNTRGGLLELRGQNLTGNICDESTFACPLGIDNVPDFDPCTWTIDELIISDGAKVNLTNRFDFHFPFDSGGTEEVLYVKNLILGENAILNTAFNKLYYGNLYAEPTARIINEPLLGFSLKNIAMDDETEFQTRITQNNLIDSDPDFNRLLVERIEGELPDPCGMMHMQNRLARDPAHPQLDPKLYLARAKGLFAKVSEERVLVQFEYLFQNNLPQAALLIYLSDTPELLNEGDPEFNIHYKLVGQLLPPPPGRPGAPDSNRFGVYQQYADTTGLNFIRGLRIELKLQGPEGASIFIDNWDPQIHCSQNYCGDVTGDKAVTPYDFLTVLSQYGRNVNSDIEKMGCLDGIFHEDGYLDIHDLDDWNWQLAAQNPPDLCRIPLTNQHRTDKHSSPRSGLLPKHHKDATKSGTQISADILILGKSNALADPEKLADLLSLFARNLTFTGSRDLQFPSTNTHLVKNRQGDIYLLNIQEGIVSLQDGATLLPNGTLPVDSEPRYHGPADVYIGIQGEAGNWWGRPLQDAAFDLAGNLYILPVVVDPNGNEPYTAAARIEFSSEPDTPPYRVKTLYEITPLPTDNLHSDYLREIEIGYTGEIYLTTSYYLNESDILWAFDADTGSLQSRLDLADANSQLYIPSPDAMLASTSGNYLYLASSLNSPDANDTTIYRLSTSDWTLQNKYIIEGMGHVTGITEKPSDGTLYVTGFTMENISGTLPANHEPFYHPRLAKITPSDNDKTIRSIAQPNNGWGSLALPCDILWIGLSNPSDLNHDGIVNMNDFCLLSRFWLTDDCVSLPDCTSVDLNEDNKVNLNDFLALAGYWLN